ELVDGLDAEKHAGFCRVLRILAGHEVDQSIRTLADIADFLAHRVQQQFAFVLTPSSDPDALDHSAAHSGYEKISFPHREAVAGVKEDVGDPDRGHPEKARRFHAFTKRLFADDFS